MEARSAESRERNNATEGCSFLAGCWVFPWKDPFAFADFSGNELESKPHANNVTNESVETDPSLNTMFNEDSKK